MADPTTGEGPPEPGPVIRDRRRLDPETGRVREAYTGGNGGSGGDAAGAEPAAAPHAKTGAKTGAEPDAAEDAASGIVQEAPAQGEEAEAAEPVGEEPDELAAAKALAEERLHDLQRLQAEFVNYRRRVERDRDVARGMAVAGVLEALLPVLDDVHLARQHGDLEGGPFAAIADKLEAVLQRFGLTRYGEPGETFDPAVHDALVHTEAELAEGTTATTVVQVLQPGYRAGDKVLRAARVAVADPAGT